MRKLLGLAMLTTGIVAGGLVSASEWTPGPRASGGAEALEAAPACGKPGLPDCPLQKWMKANIVAAKAAGDTAKLVANINKIPGLNPDPAWAADWKAMSDASAAEAKKGPAANKDVLNKACNDCHNKYRKLYREKYRDRPVPN